VLLNGLGFNRANRLTCALAEEFAPMKHASSPTETFILHCPSQIARYRAETFFTKEPDTIEWIGQIPPGETLLDVGANVGVFSLYAAKRGIPVYAVEPEAQNFALLTRNIHLNGLGARITPINVAFSDHDGFEQLFLSRLQPGAALHSLGRTSNSSGEAFASGLAQRVVTCSIDSFVERYPDSRPRHIKIDVDGAEAKVIAGAEQTLRDPAMQSLLVELSGSAADRGIAERIAACGYVLARETVDTSPAGARVATPTRNCIFVRP
jgi:FkbM family methyltransferase